MYIIVLMSEDDGHSSGDRLLGRRMRCASISPSEHLRDACIRAETRWLSVDWPSRWDILFNYCCCPSQINLTNVLLLFAFLSNYNKNRFMINSV